jgi:hypothetical protein
MAGMRIKWLSSKKSFFIEFIFKPGLLSAAIFSKAWMGWACPPISYRPLAIVSAADSTARKVWTDPIMPWKMGLFAYSLASFLEADNAYSAFFERFIEEYLEKTGRKIAPASGVSQ